MPDSTRQKRIAFVNAMNIELVASSKGSVRVALDSLIEVAGVSCDVHEKNLISAFNERLSRPVDVFKLKLGDAYVYVRIDSLDDNDQKVRLHDSIEQALRSEKLARFAADIEATKSDWTKLEYRGHNLVKIYTDRSFNDLVLQIIQEDEDICIPAKCESCKLCEIVSRGGNQDCQFCEDGRKAIEKCREDARIKPELIAAQEVYLGWNAQEDCFITAWDVWTTGSDPIGTGCVIISFKIDDDGEIRHCEHNEYCPSYRKPDSIDDASLVKFYEKNGIQMSMYELFSGVQNEMYRLTDIRLD